MKKYLSVTVTRHDGTTYRNPLMLSEAHLVSQLAKQNKLLTVMLIECHKEDYKAIFGI